MSENAGLGERGQGYGALLGGARPMVDLRHILENVLERVHAEFGQVLQMARSAPDEARCVGRARLSHTGGRMLDEK